MGLASRKQRQRIPADPRNLSWADDASRFGLSYLSKFGWDASQGLGSSGDGMKTHLKVEQKLDMMGIGAQHQRDPNGIAWKQNKEFEALLKRLNEGAEQGKETDGDDAEQDDVRVLGTAMGKAFVRAQEGEEEGKLGNESRVSKKKRKDEDGHDPDKSTRKKRKKEKHQKSNPDDSLTPTIDLTPEPSSVPPSSTIPKSRPMAHRTRLRDAKRIAGKSASAIAEILGIAPPSPASPPAPTPASSSTPVTQPSLSLDNLTTSAKSVADYFKEKLVARSSSSSSPASSAPSGSATPGLGATILLSPPDNEGELPRRGIGSRAFDVPLPQVPEAGLASAGGDSNADGQDMFTDKQRRKAERKAEKRKRRETKASHVTSEGVSTAGKEQMDEEGAERVERTSKKVKNR